jgi:hypothetical protein
MRHYLTPSRAGAVPNVARSLEADLQNLTSIALERFRCRKSDRPVAAHAGQLETGCPSSGVPTADQESKFGAVSAVITTARFVFLAVLFNIATANPSGHRRDRKMPCAAGLFLGTVESKRDLV